MSQQNNFLYFDKDNLVKAFDFLKPKEFTTEVEEIPNFMVIFGKNGVGKSRLLKAIRQQIVNSQNSIFPELIVRKLDYGKEPDSYDPDSTNHPLVNQELIEKFFECSFEKWEDIKNNNGSKEIDRVYKIYKDEIINNKQLGKNPEQCYFVEFKKYFRRQILKKICFGCLEQLLMLNVTYDNDIEKINKAFKDDSFKAEYDLEFNYKIIKNNHNIVEKLELNELIEFVSTKNPEIRIKFSDLSPGEKLILHLFIIWKDQDNIKIAKNEISTNQILLLDEPDSHCEPNLVLKLVKFLKEFLVQKLKIQVIMTCHNTTTLFCFKYEESLFILNESNDSKVTLEKKPDTHIRNELASNINYQINFLNLDFRQTYSLTKDYFQKCLGNSFEHLIKLMTKGVDGFVPSKRIEFIELLTGETFNNFAKEDIVLNETFSNLEDAYLDYNNLNKNKLYIYWPTSQTNEAWDFMIFFNKQLYLYQISTTKKNLKEQINKSEKVFNKIIEKPYFDIWIKSKFFFIKSTIKKDEDLNNQNSSVVLDLKKICDIKEIFENFFLTHQVKVNENSHVSGVSNQSILIDQNKKKVYINQKPIEFDEEINFIYELDENFYAMNFEDNTIKIFRYENEDLIFVNSLIGHSEKPKNAFFVKDENEKILIKSIDIKENTFEWNFDYETSMESFGIDKPKKNHKPTIRNPQTKDKCPYCPRELTRVNAHFANKHLCKNCHLIKNDIIET
ncbi:unnamed protein product, partial [Brachionus calyciflorus]